MIASTLQRFFSALQIEGFDVPVEISFPKKTYDRVEMEIAASCLYPSSGSPIDSIHYQFGNNKVKITKSKCPKCGE